MEHPKRQIGPVAGLSYCCSTVYTLAASNIVGSGSDSPIPSLPSIQIVQYLSGHDTNNSMEYLAVPGVFYKTEWRIL